MAAVMAPSSIAKGVGYTWARWPNRVRRTISGINHAPKIALIMPTTTFMIRPTPRPLVIPVLNQPRKIPTRMQATTLACGTEAPLSRWEALGKCRHLRRQLERYANRLPRRAVCLVIISAWPNLNNWNNCEMSKQNTPVTKKQDLLRGESKAARFECRKQARAIPRQRDGGIR
jgi:hypothetical protein